MVKTVNKRNKTLLAASAAVLAILFAAAVIAGSSNAQRASAQTNGSSMSGSTASPSSSAATNSSSSVTGLSTNNATSNTSTASSNTNSSNNSNCMQSASQLSKSADGHASSNVCEIGLSRNSPTIMLLNQSANDLVSSEFKYMPAYAIGSQQVIVISEMALTQGEVLPVEKALIAQGWEVTAIHNHELGETPLMIFLHAQKTGPLSTDLQELHTIINNDTACSCAQ